jgi:tetratricopeptide (TPR) repeat protein
MVTRSTVVAIGVMLAGGWGVACAQERTDFPQEARQRYEQGRDMQKKGQLNEALRSFEEAIKLGMDAFPRVHLQSANSNLDLKRYDTAIAQYTKLIEEFGLEDSCRYWIRSAYSGRAVAYEKKGDLEKALADHKMVVLFYALEVEILNSLEAPDRAKFMVESAQAYRARSKCLEALGRRQAAQVDQKRASALEKDAEKLASRPANSKGATAAPIRLTNGWTEPVTVVVDGVVYRLGIAEQRAIPAPGPSVAYEIQAGSYRRTGTLEAGKAYTIKSFSP